MPQDKQPHMVLICGPNGAGKSTLTHAARMQGMVYREVAEFEKGQLVKHNFTPEWFKRPLEVLKEMQQQRERKESVSAPVKNRNSGPER